jgi:hypothetical protein
VGGGGGLGLDRLGLGQKGGGSFVDGRDEAEAQRLAQHPCGERVAGREEDRALLCRCASPT